MSKPLVSFSLTARQSSSEIAPPSPFHCRSDKSTNLTAHSTLPGHTIPIYFLGRIKKTPFCSVARTLNVRSLARPARIRVPSLFRPQCPTPLAAFTKTVWYVVPLIWIPLAIWMALPYALVNGALATACQLLIGASMFTLVEYCIHRFVFHFDELLPDSPNWRLVHFLLHGIHHKACGERTGFTMEPSCPPSPRSMAGPDGSVSPGLAARHGGCHCSSPIYGSAPSVFLFVAHGV
jgi:hypothetical protein